jgi:hypothetical protein
VTVFIQDTFLDIDCNPDGEKHMNANAGNHIVIVDIRMPFISMVIFMVKAAVAAIPAFIILALLGAVTAAIFGGVAFS